MHLYTPSETADLLKIKPTTVIRLYDSGILPGILLSKGIRKRILRFSEEALKEFLITREQRQPQTEEGATCEPS